MTSTRLPGKVLLPAAGREMLAHQIDRVRRARTVGTVCIATTGNAADDPVAALAEREGVPVFRGSERSEEHTSELQSLMRISYAVFCLKKKITTKISLKRIDIF